MKKIMLGLVAATLLSGGISSCKKKEGDNGKTPTPTSTPTPAAPKNYWKLGNTSYNAIKGAKYNDANGLIFLSGAEDNTMFPDNNCNFYFSKYPTQSGTYKIVDDAKIPANDEVFILVQTKSAWYYSRNGGTVSASVTVSNGKVSIKVPAIKVYTSSGDVEDFDCNIIQTL